MAAPPALYLGNVGATGGNSTGPHAHWEVLRDGKRFPLSQTRKDIGQYLQFRLPGQQTWQQLYGSAKEGFPLNPAAVITSGMGPRWGREHRGEDYGLPMGTSLRFLGQGGVGAYPNQGAAGNVSVLETGPYQLKTFHLSHLPAAASTLPVPSTPTLPSAPGTPTPNTATVPSDLQHENDVLKAYLYGTRANKEEVTPQRSLQDQLKKELLSGLISEALTPSSFLSTYKANDPFMSGYTTGIDEYMNQLFS